LRSGHTADFTLAAVQHTQIRIVIKREDRRGEEWPIRGAESKGEVIGGEIYDLSGPVILGWLAFTRGTGWVDYPEDLDLTATL
jgi:hypothetical protein